MASLQLGFDTDTVGKHLQSQRAFPALCEALSYSVGIVTALSCSSGEFQKEVIVVTRNNSTQSENVVYVFLPPWNHTQIMLTLCGSLDSFH